MDPHACQEWNRSWVWGNFEVRLTVRPLRTRGRGLGSLYGTLGRPQKNRDNVIGVRNASICNTGVLNNIRTELRRNRGIPVADDSGDPATRMEVIRNIGRGEESWSMSMADPGT
ncbi:unnamed protein product [Gordionus sp. m RMFG-2023]